ncbi:twin-arginine translocase subunit TatC [Salinirubrum litoreum]|uniref:Twin-arginine translocase subunit TatC n=1 Tax=Salinirubrum litoreum TaxID=1126234 RepID=A0ABD5R9D5_9EURY|nr:twin-arginine translocase subunit TatC [Salinirubrum litoreum]
MVSETVHDDLAPSRGGRLLTTLRDHWLALLLAGVVSFVVAFGSLYGSAGDLLAPAVDLLGGGESVVVTSPFGLLVFTAELAGGVAVGVVALLFTGFAFRDAGAFRRDVRRTVVGPLVVAGLLFAAGVGISLTLVVPLLGELLASDALVSGFRPSYHAVWSAELVVFLPVVVGVALALPALLAAGVRGSVVHPRTLGSRWPVALLGAVLVAAFFSPPDSLTFALSAGVLLVGYGVGTMVGASVEPGGTS